MCYRMVCIKVVMWEAYMDLIFGLYHLSASPVPRASQIDAKLNILMEKKGKCHSATSHRIYDASKYFLNKMAAKLQFFSQPSTYHSLLGQKASRHDICH